MSEFAIEAHGLTRCFAGRAVVRELDLLVPRHSVFALLGRNGSGKTTTIRMLLGLLDPSRGVARVLGQDCTRIDPLLRARIGYLTEGHHLPAWMRVRECVRFQSRFFARWNAALAARVIEHFALDPQARIDCLSRGERAGLCLALTLAPEPELLILDDPAIGLDPVARRALLQAVVFVTRRAECTVLLSSHLLADVERVADHVAILDRGALRVSAPVDVLIERVTRWVVASQTAPEVPGLVHAQQVDGEWHLLVDGADAGLEAKLGTAVRVARAPVGLEEIVLGYLGERQSAAFFLEHAGAEACER
ncbi:MAG: ABC transporter ATP-binding protein [Planctomycetota bacterium]